MVVPHYAVLILQHFYYKPKELFAAAYLYSKNAYQPNFSFLVKQESIIVAKLILMDIAEYMENSFMHLFVKFTVLMILGCLVVIILFP